MTRIGLLGCGRWGRNAARTIAKHPDATLAWACDSDFLAFKSLVDGDASRYDEYRESPAWDECDAIWICTPIATHAQLVFDAIAAGKHVLCEKPVAVTLPVARALAHAAEKVGVVVMADHTWLGHAGVLGVLGSGHPYKAQRWAKDDRGFDAIEDLLPHDVALARKHFGGNVTRVSANEGVSVRVIETEEIGTLPGTNVRLSFDNRTALLWYRYDSEEKRRRVWSDCEENNGELPPSAPEPLTVILSEFLAAIRERRGPTIGAPAEWVHVAAVIEAAKASRKRGGEWVEVES